jgi:hypothetical protein
VCQGAERSGRGLSHRPGMFLGRSSVDRRQVQPVFQLSRAPRGWSPTLTLPFGSWLDAKAASASTAAGLALSRGGGECGGGSTLILLQGGFLHCEVLVSESPLSTHAGPIAVIAGGLFAVTHVGQFVVTDRSNLVTMMLDPAFRLLSAAYAITFPLMVIALVALYWREAQEAGAFGAAASASRSPARSPWLATCGLRDSPPRGSPGSHRRCSARIGPEAPWSRRGWSPSCCSRWGGPCSALRRGEPGSSPSRYRLLSGSPA